MTLPASIPSPDVAVWHLGPIPIRAYALCLLSGIVFATLLTARRLPARGIEKERGIDVALWAVPFGIVGGRLYHVISSPQAYFGAHGDPVKAFYVWEGGLGIWGAVALGAFGVWLACRHYGVSFLVFCDAIVPGLAFAQALGRFGNWFNNELYGGPTDLPWGLEIHQWDHATGRAVLGPDGRPVLLGTFHPTFLYEALWCVMIAAVLLWLDRARGVGRWVDGAPRSIAPRPWPAGRLAASYVMLYTLGRVWIEYLRIDDANHILGLRLNVWTSIAVFAFGAVWFALAGRGERGAPGASAAPGSGSSAASETTGASADH